MLNGNGLSGVSNCYVFKSRLQEYAQKAGISTPVYETVKEGPSHEPVFRSTVLVNGVRYDSLPGFFNRKAAEQSAAEVALLELMKSGNVAQCIPNPVHETGLCKNLLQEYAQKRSYPIPSYICKREGTPNQSSFTCTVEIGGIQYIGGAARTKKEAEIKAARTALLAIQSTNSEPVANASLAGQLFTVFPGKRKTREVEKSIETAKAVKPKKGKFKKKSTKRRFSRSKGKGNEDHAQNGQDDNGNVPVAHDVDLATPVSVNTNFQPPVMPNTVGSQLVELLRVAMQSTQGIHTPLMLDISSAPAEQIGSMSQCQGPIQQMATLPGLSSPVEAVKLEGVGQGLQSEQQATTNGSDSRTGDAGRQTGLPVQEIQFNQSNRQIQSGPAAEPGHGVVL
ncbi:double-stranded RNA-binding protein 8-like isoform X1 [Nymphaea colorata]|nr:double-stranded RNA-binding protein 8-like isoform X1 [Nymphaea colorata]